MYTETNTRRRGASTLSASSTTLHSLWYSLFKALRSIGVECDSNILLCRSSKIVSSIRLVRQKKIIGSNHEPTPMMRKVGDNTLKPNHPCQGLNVPMLNLSKNSAPARILAAEKMKRRQNTATAILEFFFTFSKLIVLTVAKRQRRNLF